MRQIVCSFLLILSFVGGSFLNAQSSSVKLEWDPNSEPDLAGYNIYRSNSSGHGYVLVNQSLITDTTFTDSTVEAGVTYFYVCKAIDLTDLESAPSNEVQYPVTGVSITGISPGVASPGTRITITGTGFSNGVPEIRFNGEVGLNVEVISDSELKVTVPNVASGPVEVSVFVEGAMGTYSAFTVEDASYITFYFPQVADGASGTLQFQSTLILANTGADSWVKVEFFGTPDGDPMELELGGLGTDSIFEFPLATGQSVSLSTPGTDDIQVGYARVETGESVGGVVVFRRTDLTTGISLFEAGVPAATELQEFTIFLDSLGARDTGFAIVYPPDDDASPAETPDAIVTIRLYDKQYELLAERTLSPLAPGSHMARYVNQMFEDEQVINQAQEMEGILVVTSDQPLVAVTVRQNDDPSKEFPQEVPILTTFPVIPGAPD